MIVVRTVKFDSRRERGNEDRGVWRAPRAAEVVELLGGVAQRWELLEAGLWPEQIDLSRRYGRIVRVRRGWYASLDTPAPILRALRAGGRLACVSAIAWHEGATIPEPVHVLVQAGASRIRRDGVIVHWSRRQVTGSRTVVSEAEALRQAQLIMLGQENRSHPYYWASFILVGDP